MTPPLPPALAGTAAVAGILGQTFNVVRTIADWVLAQEALKYNTIAFRLREQNVPNDEPVTLSPHRYMHNLLKISAGGNASAYFGVTLVSQSTNHLPEIGYTLPFYAFGFDNPIGDQAEVEFAGESWDGQGYMITFRGFVNPTGTGYEQFTGAVLIDRGGGVTPIHCQLARQRGPAQWHDREGFRISSAA